TTLPSYATNMGRRVTIARMTRGERQHPLKNMQDGTVDRDWFLRIVVPGQTEVEYRGKGLAARPEHRADREIEKWRKRQRDTQSLGELVGHYSIIVPVGQVRIVRKY